MKYKNTLSGIICSMMGCVSLNALAAPTSLSVTINAEIEASTCTLATTTLDLGTTVATAAGTSLKLGDVSDTAFLTNCSAGEKIDLTTYRIQGATVTQAASLMANNLGTSGFTSVRIGPTGGPGGIGNISVVASADGNITFGDMVKNGSAAGVAEVYAYGDNTLTRNEQGGTIQAQYSIEITYL